jgi:hypothetical protein
MNDQAARILASLVSRYGPSLASDPLRCEGLLRDTCPRCNREIFVLVNAVRQQVPADLLAPRHSLPMALFRGFLVKRLQDELAFSDEAAHWAVETWATALGQNREEKTDVAQSADTGSRDANSSQTKPSPSSRTTPEQRAAWARHLESPDMNTRLNTILEMGQVPDEETIRLLIAALENPSWKEREMAFDLLADGGEAAVPCLIEALGDSHDRVVTSVILLLGAARSRQATEPLIALLAENHTDIRALIWALGEIRDNRAITPLSRYLTSSDPLVRKEAEAALRKFA